MKFKKRPPVLVVIGAVIWLSAAVFGIYVAFNHTEISRQAGQEHRTQQDQQQKRREAIRRAQIEREQQEEERRRCMRLPTGEQFCCPVGERPDRRQRMVLSPRIMDRITLMCCDAGRPLVFRDPFDRSLPDGCRVINDSYRVPR